MKLEQKRLKEILDYDPVTGEFRWKVRLSRSNPGDRAGVVLRARKAGGGIRIEYEKQAYRAHILAWLYVYGEWPNAHVRHIDGNKHDNRIANLTILPTSKKARVRPQHLRSRKGESINAASERFQAKVRDLHAEGLTINAMAEKLCVGRFAIRYRLEKLGLRPNKKPLKIRPTIKIERPWADLPRKSPALERLENDVVRPGIEEKFIPLLAYRGSLSLGRCQQLWNHAILMMHAEAPAALAGTRLSHSADYAQLCGPQRPLRERRYIARFFLRLEDNPEVTDNIPGLTEYVKWFWSNERWDLHHNLIPVSSERLRPNTGAWWRTWDAAKHDAERRRRMEARQRAKDERSQAMFYPYLIHAPERGEHELLTLVNNAVPKHLPESIRADLCQDLIVAILSGDIDKSELQNEVGQYTKKVFKMFPTKYGPLSLDAPAPWATDDDRSLYDVLSHDSSVW